ncbi:helix-turn-helix transcriptional regulator [uncultured Sphingorhabdus sp.]|jgi:HTH-type transcriptional regulator, competence development regulator|uniref:helix-turn-helix domain-containing protein n=1 Tax=uncultured Sphingorhabdus sp. TaxID=1686106 RepID=UPI002627085F|nr:helix-turn-helix transcriptional regulator [uncultured Sphingorhabdus sp.]HMS20050.1 helix-turn-helix transcriptional regulator [Sphingorhabdus sp.]
MIIDRSKEWWLARAAREGNAAVSAGLLAIDPVAETHSATEQPVSAEENRIAFGKFVNLMRRQQGYSIEKLADEADLDASEVLVIEDDVHYLPEPRTVYKLAQIFKVPQGKLMELAGLVVANDDDLRREAVRFAARSESMERLTSAESEALAAFVAVLSKRDGKAGN